ncbi:hypothetical protein NTE_01944 [Candidatus Nitrososphaera evergladensis SR1]|uniref:Polyketide cyclase / dehydrase and lipid transport n=1 Tax=Candidatus Nitrososphaera evergladensis SR1 TaxID=1459636 RepID=A0A075MT71_9ARCH|nr:SRPBCC domain-containing protein [Candidatus Nitrososphaera evergladensis]AIF84002.1 hypothetical protein NTE_01944 [Candidatus Nitrososphaera evergladensis SR1]
MKEIYTEIEIVANARRVWEVLVDFAKYEEWNPFIRQVRGEPREGAKLEIHLTTPAGTKRTYEPKVTRVEPEKELRWFGKVPGFLSGEHIFTIEDAGNGRVKFIHREVFGGLLSSFFKDTDDVKAGFEEMNRALKARLEA